MSKNKIIPVPEMKYFWHYDKAKTKPKFKVDVWDNGSLKYLKHLNKDGKQHGLETTWHDNGKKRSEGNWINGKQHGLQTGWHENSVIFQLSWHENNQKMSEGKYVNDKVHGLWTFYRDNGQKSFEINYVNGKVHGKLVEWRIYGGWKDPVLDYKSVVNYKNDKLDGSFEHWHLNGQKEIEGNYVNGNEHGEWKYFDEQGKLEKTSAWDNGRLVEKPAEETQPAI